LTLAVLKCQEISVIKITLSVKLRYHHDLCFAALMVGGCTVAYLQNQCVT